LMAPALARGLALFRRHDEEMLEAQYAVRDDEAKLIQASREGVVQLKELFESDPAARGRG
jgi:hypothetical protein